MYKTIKVDRWSQVRNIGDKLVLWAFRGQENTGWPLETTIHRAAQRYDHPMDMLWHREYCMVRQFHRRAHHYCKDLPAIDQKLDWLALMQHYGAPTRLLDFSHSLYVASFFAFERAASDVAIWAVNLLGLRQLVAKVYGHDLTNENMDMANTRHIEIANQHISVDGVECESNIPVILYLEPDRLHERLLVQQGLFMFQSDISVPFEKAFFNFCNLADYQVVQEEINWPDNENDINKISKMLLLKIVIPKHVIVDAINDLNNMNISAATLFPGLDGFARSMLYNFSSFPLRHLKLSE